MERTTVSGSCSCCSSSCERSGVWRKPVTSRFDFALDLSFDPAADRGCGDPITTKSKSTSGGNAGTKDSKEEMTMMEVDEQQQQQQQQGNNNHHHHHKHHTAKISLLEPDGVEARVCSRHVEQSVRERLYLFGEDCNYSIWWFPKPDYASTVWRTDEGEEGAGLVVGDPDIVSLAKKKQNKINQKNNKKSKKSSDNSNNNKQRKNSSDVMYQNIRPTPPIRRRSGAESDDGDEDDSNNNNNNNNKDEDDGIGEELKNLILNDACESENNSLPRHKSPLSSSTSTTSSVYSATTSPAQINRDLFMAKRTGILGTKKPVVKSSAMTRTALSFDFESSSSSSSSSSSCSSSSSSSSSPGTSSKPTVRCLAPASNHRLRWLKRRELGGPGCGSAVKSYHRYEIAKNYSTSSPYSTNAMLATTPSGRAGQGLPVNLPQISTTPGGGAGGYGCGGAVRVWSDLKNISHLYHVVPLDQSEAEITLEELSHPDVFSDSRIGCSIQLIHSTANRNDQSDAEDEIVDGADEDLGEQEEAEEEEDTEPMETESLDSPQQRRHLRRSTNDMFAAVPSPQVLPRHNRIEQLRQSGPLGLRRSVDTTNTSIVPSTQSTGSAPSTPTMARLRPAIQEEPRRREEEDEEMVAAALEAQRQEEANNRRQGSAIRTHRRRSIVSATDSLNAPQVKVVSTTTPLAYKRRGGEELLQQLFEAGVHCRSRHKYVSFVDVPMPSISPTVGWPGLEEFLGRFRQMCTMSGVAIVNESRDRRRRVFVGSEHSNATPQVNGSSELRQSSSSVSTRDIKGKQSDESNHLVVGTTHHRRLSLRISSSSLASSAVIQSSDASTATNTTNGCSTSLDWQLIRERAAMIVDFRKPLTNYGSFWNEHYFRRRLSMPIHGTVLTARSDPVFACKNPDVIAHYLGEANTSGRVAPDLCDGRQPSGGSCKTLPPPLVPSDPTIVHQSYTLTFYPDLDGGFSASLEYLTLHSPNCSVSALDHIRRRFIVKHANKFQQKYFNASAEERQAMEATYASVQRVPLGRVNELPSSLTGNSTRQLTFGNNPANWNGSIWRSIEDVVAGLKVPESSKSTHTYQQDNLERVLDFLKERTCNTLAQEELQYKQRRDKKKNDTEMASDSLFRFVTEDGDDEDQEEYQLLRLFGLLEDVEKNVQKCLLNSSDRFDANQIEYDFGAPVRWTFLPSLQFYQTRITV